MKGEGVRLAFVVNNYPPRTGGVELHVRALAAELVGRGHEVTVVTLGRETGWRDDEGISVLTLPERFRIADILGFPRFGTRRRLTRLLRERGIDVVSIHTRFFPMSVVGWRAGRAAGCAVVHTEHGSDHVASDSILIRYASRLVDHSLGRAVLRGADRVLGVSEEVVHFVHRLAGVQADVFYNAIAPTDPIETRPELRRSHLVFVGRLVAGKGWEDYLGAIRALRAEGCEVSGEVLGDGADLSKVQDQVRSLGLAEVVAVRGRVAQQDVRRSLRGATLVNPTRLAEGFQTTLLEAITEDAAVVTYPVPGARVLADQGAPIHITVERSAGALTAEISRSLASQPEQAPAGLIDAWTWPARADQYLRLCAELCGSRGAK